MSCQEQTPCNPCNPNYTDTGCPEFVKDTCVTITEDIDCLGIEKNEYLSDALQHIKDVVCALTPTAYEDFDFGCFADQNITTEQQFAEFISGLLCDILGTQTPDTVTSLSSLYSSIQSLTTNLNLVKNHALSSCFQTLSGLSSPQEIGDLITAIQTILCDHEDRILDLESGVGTLAITANDSPTIDFTTSGTADHTITADVKISSTGSNAITEEADGLYVQAVSVTAVDSSTVDITASGTLNHTLTASVKLSADAGNELEARADGLYSPETDIVAADSSTINFTASGSNITGSVIIDPDVSNILTATGSGLLVNSAGFSLSNNSVTNPILRDSLGYSVIGKSTTGTGDPADITAGTDSVLRRSGSGNLEFGTLVTNNIGDDQVTFVKTQNINSSRILGRTSGGTGDIEQLTAGSHINLAGGSINTFGRTLIGITTFTEDGTWNKPTGCNAVLVYTIGGGGGGAGADASAAEAAVGSGGGAGAFALDFITAGLGATEAVIVGAGGDGGDSGNSYAGQDGSDSSFGSHTSCEGGYGGKTMASGTTALIVVGGAGGAAITGGNVVSGYGSVGDYGIRLNTTGVSGNTVGYQPGKGGESIFGNNQGLQSNGSGGAGNAALNATANGNAGAKGIIIVYEFS